MTTEFAGRFDLVAAIVMAILAGVLVCISIHHAVAVVVSPYLGCVPDRCCCPCGVGRNRSFSMQSGAAHRSRLCARIRRIMLKET